MLLLLLMIIKLIYSHGNKRKWGENFLFDVHTTAITFKMIQNKNVHNSQIKM